MIQHTGGTWRPVLPEVPAGGRNAIVSDDLNDASYDKEAIDYGGTLIAEAVLPKNMPLLMAAPALLAFAQRMRALLVLFPNGMQLNADTCKAMLAEVEALLARADAVSPTTAPPPSPAWP